MSWKIYLIIISNANNINTTDIPKKIGLDKVKATKEISIQEAQYAKGTSIVDYGDKLPEEITISKEKIFDDEELKDIKADNSKEQFKKIFDQEVSIRTTFRLTKRYFGKQFDEVGSDFEKIKVTLYE